MWRLGRYRVDDRPFATGATAEVFAARKGRAGSRVAIKLLPLKTYRERAEAEADAATIDHPRLLSVHERVIDERRGVIGLVMDLADGGDLRSALRSGDEPTPVETLQIADDVLAALEAMHAVGLVHRDVKPENVMLERADGVLRARLGDMGIARPVDRTRSTGSVLGTDLYIAPEVHDGKPPSASADLWALGYVLYESLFGAPPHASAATTYQAIGRLRAEGPDRPPNVPDSVWSVVAQLLAPLPQDRPRNATAARALLESARDAAQHASIGRSTDVSGEPRRKRSAGYRAASALTPVRNRIWGRGAAVVSALVVVGGIAWDPANLIGKPASSLGAAIAVTPLSAEEPSVIPTQYQWRLKDGVLTGRLDVRNASEEPTRATTMPELFPADVVHDGRLRLADFDGVQERQSDGSVLVRFGVPPLAPNTHHLVVFRLAVGEDPHTDRAQLDDLLRGREIAINRHAFNLSDAPILERVVLTTSPALNIGDISDLTVSGTTNDGRVATDEFLRDRRYEVVSGANVVRVEDGRLRAVDAGTAVVRVVVGLLHADATVHVREREVATTVRTRTTTGRKQPTYEPVAPTTTPESTDFTVLPDGEEDVVVE